MATKVLYNGVTLYNVKTALWEQDIVYDESGTDFIGQQFRLAFEGVIHTQRLPITDSVTYSAPIGSNAVSTYQALHTLLSQPRAPLRVWFDDFLVLDVAATQAQGGFIDMDNGPKPQRVNLTSIAGSNLLRVRFEINARTGTCSPAQAGIPADNILTNRWSTSESMDSNFFMTRTIRGTLYLAAGGRLEAHGEIAGTAIHKQVVVPALERGFKRERIDFEVDATGLKCTYVVVDKQVHTSAPWPATDMQATHREATSDGVQFKSSVSVRLQGAPSTDKALLIERAVQIADNRLNFISQTPNAPTSLIQHAEIVDSIGQDNSVELHIQVLSLQPAGEFLTHLRKDRLGKPLELPAISVTTGPLTEELEGTQYDPTTSLAPWIWGYQPHGGRRSPSAASVLLCYLQEPCSGQHAPLSNVDGSESGESPGNMPERITRLPTGSIPEERLSNYNDEARRAIYTISKITSQYVTTDMVVQMPIAKSATPLRANDPTSAFFDLAEPQSWRVFEIDVERIGEPPQIAEPIRLIRDGSLIARRHHREEKIYPPVLSPDGRHEVFRVQAKYWYCLNRPPADGEEIRIGSHPYTQGLTQRLSRGQMYESHLA